MSGAATRRNLALWVLVGAMAATATHASATPPDRSVLTGAGGWRCADWPATARPAGDEPQMQWIIGFVSGRLEEGPAPTRVLTVDQLRRKARTYCAKYPRDSIYDAARDIWRSALDTPEPGSPRK